ncbi:MAG: hypothetical protein IK106_03085 [Clostridiales bacterium]|nr:hypothetical protein [Clostridiales bacterium]
MTSILELLSQPATWEEFLKYKLSNHYLSKKEKEQFSSYVSESRYLPIARKIASENYCLGLPERRVINKSGTSKKRIIYTFSEDENLYLKCLGYLLYRYDDRLSDRCYSFRRTRSARNAIFDILAQDDRDSLFCFKADISNYFNSIPEDRLILVLQDLISDDPKLLWFFKELLSCGKSTDADGQVLFEHRGAMAGTPISPFFANVYLLSMDRYFESLSASYFRYSDDILIFARSKDELDALISDFYSHIGERGLSVNPKKVTVSSPGEPWEFLGFSYKNGQVDISDVTKDKLKGKIRRKAKALLRWKTKTGAEYERAARALIRTFNKKFYNEKNEDLFTWSRWFFPVITTDESLRELDMYLLEYVRYLDSGRHYKGNFRISYDDIKKMGFRSLKHEYYISRAQEDGAESSCTGQESE